MLNELDKTYIIDNINVLDNIDITNLLRTINAKKLRSALFDVENLNRRQYSYEISHIGYISSDLLESIDYNSLLQECNRMAIAKWGSFENYFMYRKHYLTLSRFWVREDCFIATDSCGVAKDFEELVTDILGVPSDDEYIGMDATGNSWTVTTSLMTITRYKNGNIKFKGLTTDQWNTVCAKIQFFYNNKFKQV